MLAFDGLQVMTLLCWIFFLPLSFCPNTWPCRRIPNMSQRHCHPTKRFSRVLVFAYFGCTSKSDISVPHLPYCYADMVCIPTVHARGMTSIMQSIPPRFPFLCSIGIPYYCCLHFQRIWKRSKNSRWNPFIGRINTTEPRDLVACWDVYAMYPSIHLLGLHSPRTLSPGVPDAVETLHDGKYQKNHKEADSEPSFCFCCTWIPGCVNLVSECRWYDYFFSFLFAWIRINGVNLTSWLEYIVCTTLGACHTWIFI